jgi:hypothetical protein
MQAKPDYSMLLQKFDPTLWSCAVKGALSLPTIWVDF